jgi:hypothetical protein
MEAYQKYRWFFTKSSKLVVGGKSALQNESLVEKIKNSGKDFFVMHTSDPGSPFAIILENKKNVSQSDLDECAIWCGCFSRAWRQGKRKTTVDIFTLNQIYKSRLMKKGTFGIKRKIKTKTVGLELYLVLQENKLRAVPKTLKKNILVVIKPGKIKKEVFASRISKKFKISKEEILNALPTGGFA